MKLLIVFFVVWLLLFSSLTQINTWILEFRNSQHQLLFFKKIHKKCWKKYSPRIFNYLWKQCSNWSKVKDLFNESILNILSYCLHKKISAIWLAERITILVVFVLYFQYLHSLTKHEKKYNIPRKNRNVLIKNKLIVNY